MGFDRKEDFRSSFKEDKRSNGAPEELTGTTQGNSNVARGRRAM